MAERRKIANKNRRKLEHRKKITEKRKTAKK